MRLLLNVAVFCLVAGCAKQDRACAKYVACQHAYDDAVHARPKDTADYDAGGLCWGEAGLAAQCTQQCQDNHAALNVALANLQLDVAGCR